jgi:LmbE family N-acetylglucosaminyl deacetylase
VDAVNRSRLIAGDGTPARAWRADPGLAQTGAADLAQLAGADSRVVVVAPHPDDEVLAAGGLLQLLARQGRTVLLVAVTDGEGSHAGSTEWPPERLAAVRPRESLAALACLGFDRPVLLRLGIADGGVAAAEQALAGRLAALLAPGDVLVTTWRYDGHPDHEATARACLAAAGVRGARVLEVPVWGWHWSAPGDGAIPLRDARRLLLDPAMVEKKRAALACFRSQLQPDPSTGAAAILFPAAVERMLNPWELYVHQA